MTPRMSTCRLLLLPLTLALPWLVAGCGPRITDGGFVGTWDRPLSTGSSSLSIRKEHDGYRVRWRKTDGKTTVRCDDNGHCGEFVGDREVYEWQFEAFTRPGSDDLFIRATGTPLDPQTPRLRYVDRLVLQPGGRTLLSFEIEENGIEKNPPRGPLEFRKASDRPF